MREKRRENKIKISSFFKRIVDTPNE